MKNIVIFGLQFDPNLGDRVIGHCASFLVQKALSDLKINKSVEIKEVDMLGRNRIQEQSTLQRSNPHLKDCIKSFLPKTLIDAINTRRNTLSDKNNAPKTIKRTEYVVESALDNNTCAIIIAGGGLIKYKAQQFYLLIDVITRLADQHSIPVMLNAVGVEGFDASSRQCLILKKALNRTCVKTITTRDDITLLDGKYIDSEIIHTRRVPDPAFWVDEIYKPTTNQTPAIGLSVARSNIFIEHGIKVTGSDLQQFWVGVTKELDCQGFRWKFFCNGTFEDFEFLRQLVLDKYPTRKFEEVALDRATNPQMLVDQICSFSSILSVRLHAAIISYAYRIPVVQLVWNDKQVLFGKSIGYEERFVTHDKFDTHRIVKILLEANSKRYEKYSEKDNREKTYDELLSFIKKYVVEVCQ